MMSNNTYAIHDFNDKIKRNNENFNVPTFSGSGTRIYICGASGSGKTNFLMNFLTIFLSYDNLYLYCPEASIDQSKYELLKQLLLIKRSHSNKKFSIAYQFTTEIQDISLIDMDANTRNIIVIDDALSITTKKDIMHMNDILTSSRHKNVIVFILTQDYFEISKTCRGNCNMKFIGKLPSKLQIRSIYQDLVLENINLQQFTKLYDYTQHDAAYNFLCIDSRVDIPDELKIRKNLIPINLNQIE